MSLINDTFFVVNAFVPQLGQLTVKEKLQLYIDRYEPKFLALLMGTAFAQAFVTGLAEPAPEQRWIDLRDGKTYTDDQGNTFVWPGLANSITKESAIALYVYYWFTRSNATFSTGSGEVAPEVENGTRANASAKQAQAWNEMLYLNFSFIHFMRVNKDVYPEWDGTGWGTADYEYFLGWWPVYYASRPYFWWWPERCERPDIFYPINDFGI
jgi:hypothetical protein